MVSARMREWYLESVKELSPKGKRMFRILRDRGELTVKEWAQALDMYRDSFNGNERRQLALMMESVLVIRDSRLIEFERVTEAGWHGDTWQGVKAEWSHRGRYYVYMVNPEALQALEPPPAPKPARQVPKDSVEIIDWELDYQYKPANLRERIEDKLFDIGERVWRILQTP